MFIKVFIILFSTSVASLTVAMALESANPFSIFSFAHVVILTGMIISTPSIIFGYLYGSVLWDQGVRTYKPYLYTALVASLVNGSVLSVLLGAPWMEGKFFVMALLLGAFACGGVVASALSFALMHSLETHGIKWLRKPSVKEPV